MAFDRFRISVVAEAVSNDVRAVPRAARELGFSGLQFDAHSPLINLAELSGSGRKEFKHLLSTYSQQLVGLRITLPGEGLGERDIDRAIALLEGAMEVAAGLGAPLLCADVGRLPEPPDDETPPPAPISPELAGLLIIPKSTPKPAAPKPPAAVPRDEAAEAQVAAALVEICRRADRYGVVLAMRSDLSSIAAIERAIRPTACPWFGVDLDPAALLRDAWPVDEVFSRLGNLIRHVRAHDAMKGSDRRTKPMPLGTGSTDWKQLLSNLDAADFNGWISVDPQDLPDCLSAARVGRERLSKLLF